jgi:hypothetical protein
LGYPDVGGRIILKLFKINMTWGCGLDWTVSG